MKELQIFNSEEFGEIRTVQLNNETYFVGKDVATALGYANPKNAVPTHVSEEDKLSTQIEYAGQKMKRWFMADGDIGKIFLVGM